MTRFASHVLRWIKQPRFVEKFAEMRFASFQQIDILLAILQTHIALFEVGTGEPKPQKRSARQWNDGAFRSVSVRDSRGSCVLWHRLTRTI